LAWLHRPGVMAIFALTLFGIFYPMIKERREAKAKAAEQPVATTTAVAERPNNAVHFGAATWFTAVTIVLLALALWQSRNFGYRAGLFPWAIGIPTFILAIAQLGRDLYGKKKNAAASMIENVEEEIDPAVVRKRTIEVILWTIGFFLAIWILGFSYAVPLTILLYLKFAGKESWLMTAMVTFFSWLFYWGLFEKLLNVPFPEGLLISLIKGGQ